MTSPKDGSLNAFRLLLTLRCLRRKLTDAITSVSLADRLTLAVILLALAMQAWSVSQYLQAIKSVWMFLPGAR